MEYFKLLLSAKAWEVVVAIVGGYLAAKDLENLSRKALLACMASSVVIGFCIVNFTLPLLAEKTLMSQASADNLRPLAIVLCSAAALKIIDIMYGLLAQIKEIKIKDIKLSWRKDK